MTLVLWELVSQFVADKTATAIREEFENADIKIDGMNWAEAGNYPKITSNRP